MSCGSVAAVAFSASGEAVDCCCCGEAIAMDVCAVGAGSTLTHDDPGRPIHGVVILSPLTNVYLNSGSTRRKPSSTWIASSPLPSPSELAAAFSPDVSATDRGSAASKVTSNSRDKQYGALGPGWGGSSPDFEPAAAAPLPALSVFLGGMRWWGGAGTELQRRRTHTHA